MNREQLLRNLILDKYISLRQFSIEADIPYSSLMTILSRGIGGASFDMVMHICNKLEIDPGTLTVDTIAKNSTDVSTALAYHKD